MKTFFEVRQTKTVLFCTFHFVAMQIVEIKEKTNQPCEMEYNFHLAFVKHIATDDEPIVGGKIEIELPKKYMAIQSIVQFDTFTATHGPGTSVDGKYDNTHMFFFTTQFIVFILFTDIFHDVNNV